MKKQLPHSWSLVFTLLLFGFAMFKPSDGLAQCTFEDNAYPTAPITAPTNSTVVEITDCSFTGEHAIIAGMTAGLTYTFTISDISPGYVTIFDNSDNPVAFGNAPFVFAPATTGTYKAQWAVDNTCDSDFDCHITTIQLTGPVAPPAITQDPTAPTCAAGTSLSVSGTPLAGIQWYWQTSATGTSTATAYSGPYIVFANGTYYLRAYSSSTNTWSVASAYTVTNMPTSVAPPAAIAAQSPACATTGTTLSASGIAPIGFVWYWQGTNASGTSNTLPATAPYAVTASGTYYLASFETATQCWSTAVGTPVVIETAIPAAPVAAPTSYSICSGTVSQQIVATAPPTPQTMTFPVGTNIASSGNGTSTTTVTIPALPAGAVVTSAQLKLVNVTSINGSYRSEIRVAASGIVTLAATQISTAFSPGLITPDPSINLTGYPAAGGVFNLLLTETYNDLASDFVTEIDDATFGAVSILVNYTIPGNPVKWYDAATAGTQVGTGSPLEAVGTTVLPNTSTPGTYNFYAESDLGVCTSATRTLVSIAVAPVLATLVPVNATCNGLNNGTFNLGTVQCGTAPFTYSVAGINGGAFGPIPTNLVAGTYQVTVKDAGAITSAPIQVVITEPTAPTALAANTGLTAVSLSWTAQGNETDWSLEYGPTGFTLGTGTPVDPATNPQVIEGLDQGTTYQFYVAAGCTDDSDFAGPFTFTTDAPFQVYDNDCGPGFTDISATGTLNNLTDDGEVTITLPFPFTLQGTTYNNATIANNGGLLFVGNDLGWTNAAVGTAPIGLYPFWDDLGGNGAGTFYQTTGTAPNRKFIVQWVRSHNAVSGNTINFEIIIDEATGEFYYLYNDVDFANATYSNGASATIGVSSATDIQVSINSGTYLANNSCIHFYTAACPDPVNLVVTPHELDADIAWTAGAYGETNWTIIYGPAGFNLGTEGDTTTSTTNSANIGFGILEQNTEYDVYIFSECTLDNLTSENGLMGTFTTLPFCKTPTNPTAATDIDSLEAAWNWTANTNFPTYAIESFNIQYGTTGFELGTGTMYTATGTNNADTVFNAGFLAGGVYQYYVQAVCGGADSVSPWAGPRTFIMPLSNDDACTPETIVVDGPVYTFNNTGASVATGEAAIAPPASGAQTATGWVNQTLNGTVWFTFTAPASGNVRVNSTGINYNGQVAIYKVNSCSALGTYELLAANDDAIGGTSLAPNFTVCGLEEDETYYLLFDAFNATAGNYSLALTSINLDAGLANVTPPTWNVCTGANVDLFSTITNEQPGGTWSSSIAAVNASITGSDLETAGLAYSTFDLQYRVTEGCAYDSIIGKVKIFAPSNAGQDGTITACRNESINLLAGLGGNADFNGTWYNPLGATVQSDIVTANTQGNYNYKYIVNNTVCPNDTAIVVVNVIGTCNQLGVSEEAFAGVEVFPNPSAGIVFVTSDINFSYVVTDANGRVVTTAQNGVKAAQKTEINLSNVERGVYFIRLNNEDAQKTYRIVIN